LLYVHKRLTVRSTQGAGATVLDAGGAIVATGVLITADGVVFGQQDRGFTITGLTSSLVPPTIPSGIDVRGPSNVSVAGNMVVGNRIDNYGIFLIGTSGSKVVGNLVSGEQLGPERGPESTLFGIVVVDSTGASVTSNVATRFNEAGFGFGGGVVATGNVAIGNRGRAS
jgi:parallel beta-helix repeat protein